VFGSEIKKLTEMGVFSSFFSSLLFSSLLYLSLSLFSLFPKVFLGVFCSFVQRLLSFSSRRASTSPWSLLSEITAWYESVVLSLFSLSLSLSSFFPLFVSPSHNTPLRWLEPTDPRPLPNAKVWTKKPTKNPFNRDYEKKAQRCATPKQRVFLFFLIKRFASMCMWKPGENNFFFGRKKKIAPKVSSELTLEKLVSYFEVWGESQATQAVFFVVAWGTRRKPKKNTILFTH